MVNLEERKIVDLIEGRDSGTVSNWLKKFKNIKIASRDGSNTYKSAIEKANSNIIQVSDRFHLIKSLSEALVKYLKIEYSKNIILTDISVENDDFEEQYKQLSPKAKESYEKRNILFKQIKQYYNHCNNYSKTARKFGVDRNTVKSYVHMDRLPIIKRDGNTAVDKYKDVIINNLDKQITEIYEIIQKKGYEGNYTNLYYYIRRRSLKVSTSSNNKFVNRTNIAKILNHSSISDLNLTSQEEKDLKRLVKMDKKLSNILKINDDFYIAIFSGKIERLNKWINEAKGLKIDELNSFINALEKDVEAVKNAITYINISNGITEGKNCKMKYIKRMMYGRCGTNLLRAKLLQSG